MLKKNFEDVLDEILVTIDHKSTLAIITLNNLKKRNSVANYIRKYFKASNSRILLIHYEFKYSSSSEISRQSVTETIHSQTGNIHEIYLNNFITRNSEVLPLLKSKEFTESTKEYDFIFYLFPDNLFAEFSNLLSLFDNILILTNSWFLKRKYLKSINTALTEFNINNLFIARSKK